MATDPFVPTEDDIARKLGDTFESDYVAAAKRVLDAYDTDRPALDARVKLAAVYLSGGDLDQLRRRLDEATLDYRDVLAWAESEAVMQLGPTVRPGDPAYTAAQQSDEERYRTWVGP